MNEHILNTVAEICSQTRRDLSILKRINKTYSLEITSKNLETVAQVGVNKIKDIMFKHDKVNFPI